MFKTREDSRIEIWRGDYINNPRRRYKEDRDVTIIQIEPAKHQGADNYIVEVVDNA